ncbi:MAG: OmpA family protein [Betaproteobacteria bacterium]|nr:OmpA family protein [Betaproteobacteria bacterium]
MTQTLAKKKLSLAVLCAVLGVVSGAAGAQTNPAETGYLTDERHAVTTSGVGLCWHTGTGPAPVSTLQWDPNFVPASAAKAVAPLEPVAVAAVTPEPLKTITERVTLDADTLFDFDQATLRSTGRAALDEFAGKIKGIDPEMITAVGHADRLGSGAYNQRLSEQRAEAVKIYLVSKGVAPDRMHTEGKGEMQPVTKSGECDGAQSAKVIACLQPDRRVEVEVVGTRVAK